MILIALGANLPSQSGAPADTLHAALGLLCDNDVRLGQVSRFYRTPAWPDPADPPFINAVARIETARDPAALMDLLHRIEGRFGRARAAKNAPRTLDLDLVDYQGLIQAGPPQLPHPRLEVRGFVLIPLRDVAPGWRHPRSGRSVTELIAALPSAERDAIRPVEDA